MPCWRPRTPQLGCGALTAHFRARGQLARMAVSENGGSSAAMGHGPASRPSAVREAAGDILVVGAGAVGLAAALGLAQAGFKVLLSGQVPSRSPGRTVALFQGALALLARLGLHSQIVEAGAPLRTMRIIDDTGSLFRIPPVDFKARELNLDAFGFNIENERLVALLAAAVRSEPRIDVFERPLGDVTFSADGVAGSAGETRLVARLAVAADGRQSLVRRAAGIGVRSWAYPQVALTVLLRHEAPHRDVSTEFHTRQGPFTLVPLPPLPDAPHRSSLVWVMRPDLAKRRAALPLAALGSEITRQSRFLLGAITCEGPPGLFPLSGMIARRLFAPRVALIGEAAHVFPPIGAQGLNLGYRDVADLLEAIAGGGVTGDPGAADALERFGRLRERDVATRTMGVDILNRALLTPGLPVDLARGAGLLALSSAAPLRRFVMRHGLTPGGARRQLLAALET